MNKFLAALLCFILFGCSNSVFEAKYDIPEGKWQLAESAQFEFETAKTDSVDFKVNVRSTIDYKYQNIYITYYLLDSTEQLITKKLVNFQLFDPKTGRPLGKGIGDINDVERTVLPEYTLPYSGKYKFRIDQFMREESLENVLSVGLKVVPSSQK